MKLPELPINQYICANYDINYGTDIKLKIWIIIREKPKANAPIDPYSILTKKEDNGSLTYSISLKWYSNINNYNNYLRKYKNCYYITGAWIKISKDKADFFKFKEQGSDFINNILENYNNKMSFNTLFIEKLKSLFNNSIIKSEKAFISNEIEINQSIFEYELDKFQSLESTRKIWMWYLSQFEFDSAKKVRENSSFSSKDLINWIEDNIFLLLTHKIDCFIDENINELTSYTSYIALYTKQSNKGIHNQTELDLYDYLHWFYKEIWCNYLDLSKKIKKEYISFENAIKIFKTWLCEKETLLFELDFLCNNFKILWVINRDWNWNIQINATGNESLQSFCKERYITFPLFLVDWSIEEYEEFKNTIIEYLWKQIYRINEKNINSNCFKKWFNFILENISNLENKYKNKIFENERVESHFSDTKSNIIIKDIPNLFKNWSIKPEQSFIEIKGFINNKEIFRIKNLSIIPQSLSLWQSYWWITYNWKEKKGKIYSAKSDFSSELIEEFWSNCIRNIIINVPCWLKNSINKYNLIKDLKSWKIQFIKIKDKVNNILYEFDCINYWYSVSVTNEWKDCIITRAFDSEIPFINPLNLENRIPLNISFMDLLKFIENL